MKSLSLTLFAAIVSISTASCSNASSVSGIYVQKTGNSVLLVQVVKTVEGHMTGRLENVFVAADGNIKDESFPLDGSVDGDQISFKANEFFGMGASFTGTIDGNVLKLASDSGQSILRRSDLDTFLRDKASMNDVARATIAANERAKEEAEKQTLLLSLHNEAVRIDELLPKLSSAEAASMTLVEGARRRHDKIAQNIKALQAQQLITPKNDREFVLDDIQAQQDDMQALRSDLQAKVDDFRDAYDRARGGIAQFKTDCETAIAIGAMPRPDQCMKIADYISTYENSRATVRKNFESIDTLFDPN